jgi:electron transport complex protein RnfC
MRQGSVTSVTDNDSASPSGRLHRFHGGLVLPGQRENTASLPVRNAGIPPLLVLPLQQHIGEAAECLVTPGDRVLKGQMIAAPRGNVSAPIHASSSGIVIAVDNRPFPHPAGIPAPAIVIETDGADEWIDSGHKKTDYRQQDSVALLERIREAGIVGLGGAGFPTQVKLGSSTYHNIDLLVINGVECEPYISCDNRLMQEQADEILAGVMILQHILQPRDCVIAIEDHMPAAEDAMRRVVSKSAAKDIRVTRVPEIYPSGGERQLIKLLTGREVPSQGFPADIGIICQNVGTAAAVYQAVVHDEPLISRIVTVAGAGVEQPCNIEVLIGTSFNEAIKACGGYSRDRGRLLMGGPMMGFAVHTDAVPVIKTTNCILAASRREMPPPLPAQPCIRCSKCTDVCPADLLPQQLYWYSHSNNLDAAQDYNLFDCIECGCCAYVCPSHIPLVQYYRHAKAAIWTREKQKKSADIARQRHAARQARLERIKQERAARLARKRQALSGDGDNQKQAAIQAALERVKQKKSQIIARPKNVDHLTAEQEQLIRKIDKRRQGQPGKDDGN